MKVTAHCTNLLLLQRKCGPLITLHEFVVHEYLKTVQVAQTMKCKLAK
jgi:hypothetical protein